MSYLKSLKLKRQQFAYKVVTEYQGNKKEYKSTIESLGMMIYNNGLVSTLTQLKLKKREIYNQLNSWIKDNPNIGFDFNGCNNLLDKVVNIEDPMILNALTAEILTLTDTLKEITKAEIHD